MPVFLVVTDSVGIGGAPDADKYFGEISDFGSNTVLHIAQYMEKLGRPLKLPQLNSLGLGSAIFHSASIEHPTACFKQCKWAVGRKTSKEKTPHRAIGKSQIAGYMGLALLYRKNKFFP